MKVHMSEKQEKYLDAKDTVIRYLRELSEILEIVGEEPLSGEKDQNL